MVTKTGTLPALKELKGEGGWKLLKADVHKLECALESPGGLIKTQMLSPPLGSLIEWSGVALHSSASPSDAADGDHILRTCALECGHGHALWGGII